MHGIRKYRHHAVRTGRNAIGHLLKQSISVHSHALGNQFFFRAKGVPEPAHRQPGKETDRLRLRHARNDVWIHSNIHVRIGTHLRQIHHLLPERPAENRRLPGTHNP
ncbi:hypothetical protein D3C86_1708370 [compost metagenome]